MNTYTQSQINALVSAGIDLNEFFTGTVTARTVADRFATMHANTASADAEDAICQAEIARQDAHDDAPTTKTLTRGAWKTLRMTKGGKVRKAFVGLTREQAYEAGLCEGFHLPTGEMKAHFAALKNA